MPTWWLTWRWTMVANEVANMVVDEVADMVVADMEVEKVAWPTWRWTK